MNDFRAQFGYLQVSAEALGIFLHIIGYGQEAYWPDGLGVKINALRHWVFRDVEDDDIVVFVDAFDVMLFGGNGEIASAFEKLEQKHGKSLFFNAEPICFPPLPDICNDKYPGTPDGRFHYMNSGA